MLRIEKIALSMEEEKELRKGGQCGKLLHGIGDWKDQGLQMITTEIETIIPGQGRIWIDAEDHAHRHERGMVIVGASTKEELGNVLQVLIVWNMRWPDQVLLVLHESVVDCAAVLECHQAILKVQAVTRRVNQRKKKKKIETWSEPAGQGLRLTKSSAIYHYQAETSDTPVIKI